ncbi:helix-turn-helix domain-containing protein [Streptococcus sp. 20-1249]|uniref:helix-turn-helix domain-containing protein n=1 Tax=Streptococcus hepaticus TaxID=3349163 RepID=UPI003748CBC5
MIENYIEKKIIQQVTLINLLLDFREIDLKSLLEIAHISEKDFFALLPQLQSIFHDSLTIVCNNNKLTLTLIQPARKSHFFHQIFQNSTFLQFLFFLIQEDELHLHDFADKYFISLATAYRLKNKCISYLKKVGLDCDKNTIVGPEYRMRFLLATLYYRFGFSLYEFTESDHRMIFDLIQATNTYLPDVATSLIPEEQYFFSYLIFLSWKRQGYSVSVPYSEEFEILKFHPVYSPLRQTLKQNLADKFENELTDGDIDYLFLAYGITDNPLFKDRWRLEVSSEFFAPFFAYTRLNYLLPKFEAIFGKEVTDSFDFQLSVLFCMRRFLCDIHDLIPDHYLFEYIDPPYPKRLFQIVEKLLRDWGSHYVSTKHIAKHHIVLLTIQLSEILKNRLKPIPLVIVANNQANLNMIASFIRRNFTTYTTKIQTVNLLSEKFIPENHTEKAVLLAEQQYIPFLKEIYGEEQYQYITISINFNDTHYKTIYENILAIREQQYEDYLDELYHKLHKKKSKNYR